MQKKIKLNILNVKATTSTLNSNLIYVLETYFDKNNNPTQLSTDTTKKLLYTLKYFELELNKDVTTIYL